MNAVIDFSRNCTPVFSRYFGNADFLTEPHTYSDLGARIVAEELADHLYDHGSDDAHAALLMMAFGEDDEAIEHARSCRDWEANGFRPQLEAR